MVRTRSDTQILWAHEGERACRHGPSNSCTEICEQLARWGLWAVHVCMRSVVCMSACESVRGSCALTALVVGVRWPALREPNVVSEVWDEPHGGMERPHSECRLAALVGT